ncbi:hypothetical protein D3C72_2179400 [compost metagenome]
MQRDGRTGEPLRRGGAGMAADGQGDGGHEPGGPGQRRQHHEAEQRESAGHSAEECGEAIAGGKARHPGRRRQQCIGWKTQRIGAVQTQAQWRGHQTKEGQGGDRPLRRA